MNYIIPPAYHPSKAVGRKRVGSFDIYRFSDGAKLTVRRMFAERLFQKAKKAKLRARTNVALYGAKFVVRRVRFVEDALRVDTFNRIFTAKARFESPVAWLERKTGRPVMVTRFKSERGFKTLMKKKREMKSRRFGWRVWINLARELGKLHGAGVAHGHLHSGNVLADEKGNIYFIDPKGLRRVRNTQHIEPNHVFVHHGFIKRGEKTSSDITNDLLDLTSFPAEHGYLDIWENPAIVENYRKGLEEARKRIENLEKQRKR